MTRPRPQPPFTTVVLGADHQGAVLARDLASWLSRRGLRVENRSSGRPGDDYPHIAATVVRALANARRATGVLICGSGNGMAMAANRYAWIRAALAPTPSYASKARQDEDANVLVLPAWWVRPNTARRILAVWLATLPSRAARHRRRIRQLTALPHG